MHSHQQGGHRRPAGFVGRLLAAVAGLLFTFLLPAIAAAAGFVVTGAGEPASAGATSCSGSFCSTLRDAINSALASADPTSIVNFAPALDGASIKLVWCTNAASGSEFGRSAFFITGSKSIYIDGITGLSRGITIERDTVNAQSCAAAGNSATATFRLFDVDAGSGLSLAGLTLKNGAAVGGSSRYGGGALGAGGAIFSRGDLTLDRCTVADNVAQGGNGGDPALSYGGAGVGGDATSSAGGAPNGGAGVGSNPGGLGGGGSAYDGGASGGFGGGGGAGGTTGGNGGFGAGGGARGSVASGIGGFGGGNGGTTTPGDGGGGGAGMGGAIFNDGGTLTVTNSTFTANAAIGGDGGGSNAGSGAAFGGAVFNYSGAMHLTYATLARNSVAAGTGASADGGAVYSLSDNACANGGNACATAVATTEIISSILANSTGSTNELVVAQINGAATAPLGSQNLIMSQTGYLLAAIAGSGDPQLSPLGNHGGTSPTLVPQEGSAAIDSASCGALPPLDQRGVARPQPAPASACDIGAVEYDGDYLFADGFD